MLNIEENTVTAGAFIIYEGYFLFMFGHSPSLGQNALGIIRFGGHREKGETVIECVKREIKEETTLESVFFANNVTYGFDYELNGYKIIGSKSPSEISTSMPILITNHLDDKNKLSTIYLVHGMGDLMPSMETQGILMLRPEDVEYICSKKITFADFIAKGGKFILTEKLKEIEKNPENFFLVPRTQLLFLNQLLKFEPELIKRFFCGTYNNKSRCGL